MNILLVDDNFPFPMVFESLLLSEGITLRHCTDPESALAAVSEHEPDLMMIEENLGSFSGLLLYRLMKLDTRVIVTSVVPPDRLLQQEMDDLNVNEFMLKPFAHYQLIPRILRLLGREEAAITTTPMRMAA